MKIFDGFNQTGHPCPICVTKDDKPCTLVPISGTEKNNNVMAIAVHIECLDLVAFAAEGKRIICHCEKIDLPKGVTR